MMPDFVPSVARVVHYHTEGSPRRPDGSQKYRAVCVPAFITETNPNSDWVSLAVFNPKGLFFQQEIRRDEDEMPSGGTWHDPRGCGA
jgi:hypothetical protein